MPKRVSVSVTTTAQPAAICITVGEEPVSLKGEGLHAKIHWEIDPNTPGWWFVPAGIVLQGDWGGKFEDHGRSADKKQHTWVREAIDNVTYKYTISVTDGARTATWDPSIINEN